MYSIDWPKVFGRNSAGQPSPEESNDDESPWPRGYPPAAGATVWGLGLTSFLTDISSEMVASILPAYLVLHLGMTPLAFGVVDGTHQGAAALARLAGGMLADRWQKPKLVATAGYAMSAACRPLLFGAGAAWNTITLVIAIDRIGKGIRTAPRDALLSQSVPTRALASAFGVHRSMDAAGAMLGPLLAFALLTMLPDAYDVLFVASFAAGLLGVAAIVLLVPALPAIVHDSSASDGSGSSARLVSTAGDWHRDREFRALLVAGSLLALGTVSDSFVLLVLQQNLHLDATTFPLLYVGTPLMTSVFAVGCGRLADRHGRPRVLLTGYVALAFAYASLLLPLGGALLAIPTIGLLGLHYAATDGVLAAMAAARLPTSHLGTGLATLSTATNLVRFAASVGFGFLWTRYSSDVAILVALSVLLSAVAVAALLLSDRKTHG